MAHAPQPTQTASTATSTSEPVDIANQHSEQDGSEARSGGRRIIRNLSYGAAAIPILLALWAFGTKSPSNQPDAPTNQQAGRSQAPGQQQLPVWDGPPRIPLEGATLKVPSKPGWLNVGFHPGYCIVWDGPGRRYEEYSESGLEPYLTTKPAVVLGARFQMEGAPAPLSFKYNPRKSDGTCPPRTSP